MADKRQEGDQPVADQPQAGNQQEQGQQPVPEFGHSEAEAVAAVQDEAVQQGLLPPGQGESGPADK